MKARLLSNVTMNPIVAHLQDLQVDFADFNAYLLELVNPVSPSATGEAPYILCLPDSDVLMGERMYGPDEATGFNEYLQALEQFCTASPGKVVAVSNICLTSARYLSYAEATSPDSLRELEWRSNESLRNLSARHANLVILDVQSVYRRFGEKNLISPAFWYAGRIRYTQLMFRELARLIEQTLKAYSGSSKKVLVLDLDNTLWGGILGEAGPEGVVLSEDGTGKCYRDFQRAIRSLKNIGVLLAIASKNNPQDVEELFSRNTMMILRREDFVAMKVDWNSKAENIVAIAQSLNLGLDSFVFIDDNPVERAAVRETLPALTVPEFPGRPEQLPGWFAQDIVYEHFSRYVVTAEDTSKQEQYTANFAREEEAARIGFDDFLQQLDIRVTYEVDNAAHVQRASQMTQKTNQFNVTTRRYTPADISRLMESNAHSVVLLEYRDKFASEGIVGLAILDYAEAAIDSFLLSCRVIGRKVEFDFLSFVEKLFRERDIKQLTGRFIPTAKNAPAAKFFEQAGYTLTAQDGERSGDQMYVKEL